MGNTSAEEATWRRQRVAVLPREGCVWSMCTTVCVLRFLSVHRDREDGSGACGAAGVQHAAQQGYSGDTVLRPQ